MSNPNGHKHGVNGTPRWQQKNFVDILTVGNLDVEIGT
jgi:hypothetical protein